MRKFTFLLLWIVFLACVPAAHAQIYRVVLSGANEIPAVTTPGTGSAIITFNPTTHEMRVRVGFSGLTGTSTAAHVHCCGVQPSNVGVATTTPTFIGTPLGVTSGSWDRIYDMSQAGAWNPVFVNANGGSIAATEAAFLAGVAAGQVYLNIHSSTFGGGEIRGFLVLNKFAASANAGAQGAAGVLDSFGAGTGALNDVLVSLAELPTAQQTATLDKLTPNSSRGTLVVVTETVGTVFDQVSNRLDGLRLADGQTVIPSALGTLPDQKRHGLWGAANGVNSRQKSVDGFAGYRNGGWGLTAGLDHRLGSRGVIGGAVTRTESKLTYRNQSAGDYADIEGGLVSFYATHGIGRAFIEGMGAYGWQDYDTTRNTGVSGLATGDFDGHLWGFRVGAGLPIGLSSHVAFTPQGRLDWGSVKQEGYTEYGGGPLALAVTSRSADGFFSSLGGQIDFASTLGDFKIRPFVRGFWQHNFSDDALDASSKFVAGGVSFVTPGQNLARDPYHFGTGINFFTEGAFTAAIVYDGHFAKSYQSHVYQAKLRWTF